MHKRPGRKIISVIELMGLSETEEQPRAAKEEGGGGFTVCAERQKEKEVSKVQ